MRVFIDTNIYLTFIEAKGEKLSSLSVLRQNLKKRSIELIFPQVTYDEIIRNVQLIKNKYNKYLTTMVLPELSIPTSVRETKITSELNDLRKKYKERIDTLKGDYLVSVDSLLNDEINVLYKNATVVHPKKNIIELASLRHSLGNPPGKGGNNPIGDELEWEILLNNFTDQDLIVITNDGDWKDINDENEEGLNYFLNVEWKSKTDKNITFYKSLGEFINEKIKPTKPISKEEIETEERISEPIGSGLYINPNIVPVNGWGTFGWGESTWGTDTKILGGASPVTISANGPVVSVSGPKAESKMRNSSLGLAYVMCALCHSVIGPDDKFCSQCGKAAKAQ